MSDDDKASPPRDPLIPQAVAIPRKRRHAYAVWLIPAIAALIALTLGVRALLESGPTITINFKNAEGLEPGKTKIKYKNVDIGDVKTVTLSPESDGVVVTADMAKGAQKLLREDTRFWVERARFAGGGVTGLSTLLSGAYIGIDVGKEGESRRHFNGLDTPPSVTADEPGREFVLRSNDLGSIDIGAPVYFRRVQVGKVTQTQLDEDGRGVTLRVFIAAPNEKLVTQNTRFWHASGLDVALDAGGVRVQTQSLVSVVLGGIAFGAPEGSASTEPAQAEHNFRLFDDQTSAMKRRNDEVITAVAYFSESLRGLSPGAQVDFRGVVIGEVTSIDVEFDRKTREFRFPVEFVLYGDRLNSKVSAAIERAKLDPIELLQHTIDRGLRAQLRTSNLLTGQRFVALDFFKGVPKAGPMRTELRQPTAPTVGASAPTVPVAPGATAGSAPAPQTGAEAYGKSIARVEIPTISGSLEDLQASLTNIAKSLESVPFEQIGNDVRTTMRTLDATLKSTDKLVQRLDGQVDQLAPELRAALTEARGTLKSANELMASDAPTQQQLREALRELSRAAQSLRELTDYVQRRPESLLRGKPAEAEPTANTATPGKGDKK